MGLKIILFALCLYYIGKNYIKSKTRFNKASVWHFVTSIAIIIYFSDSVSGFIELISNFDKEFRQLSDGLIGADIPLNIANRIYYIIISLLVFFNGFGILNRDEKTRRIFVKLILFLIPAATITIYIESQKSGNPDIAIIILVGLVLSSLVYGSLSYLYNRRFMVDFFSQNNSADTA